MKIEIEINEEQIAKWAKSAGKIPRWQVQEFVRSRIKTKIDRIVQKQLADLPNLDNLVEDVMKELDIKKIVDDAIKTKLYEKGYF